METAGEPAGSFIWRPTNGRQPPPYLPAHPPLTAQNASATSSATSRLRHAISVPESGCPLQQPTFPSLMHPSTAVQDSEPLHQQYLEEAHHLQPSHTTSGAAVWETAMTSAASRPESTLLPNHFDGMTSQCYLPTSGTAHGGRGVPAEVSKCNAADPVRDGEGPPRSLFTDYSGCSTAPRRMEGNFLGATYDGSLMEVLKQRRQSVGDWQSRTESLSLGSRYDSRKGSNNGQHGTKSEELQDHKQVIVRYASAAPLFQKELALAAQDLETQAFFSVRTSFFNFLQHVIMVVCPNYLLNATTFPMTVIDEYRRAVGLLGRKRFESTGACQEGESGGRSRQKERQAQGRTPKDVRETRQSLEEAAWYFFKDLGCTTTPQKGHFTTPTVPIARRQLAAALAWLCRLVLIDAECSQPIRQNSSLLMRSLEDASKPTVSSRYTECADAMSQARSVYKTPGRGDDTFYLDVSAMTNDAEGAYREFGTPLMFTATPYCPKQNYEAPAAQRESSADLLRSDRKNQLALRCFQTIVEEYSRSHGSSAALELIKDRIRCVIEESLKDARLLRSNLEQSMLTLTRDCDGLQEHQAHLQQAMNEVHDLKQEQAEAAATVGSIELQMQQTRKERAMVQLELNRLELRLEELREKKTELEERVRSQAISRAKAQLLTLELQQKQKDLQTLTDRHVELGKETRAQEEEAHELKNEIIRMSCDLEEVHQKVHVVFGEVRPSLGMREELKGVTDVAGAPKELDKQAKAGASQNLSQSSSRTPRSARLKFGVLRIDPNEVEKGLKDLDARIFVEPTRHEEAQKCIRALSDRATRSVEDWIKWSGVVETHTKMSQRQLSALQTEIASLQRKLREDEELQRSVQSVRTLNRKIDQVAETKKLLENDVECRKRELSEARAEMLKQRELFKSERIQRSKAALEELNAAKERLKTQKREHLHQLQQACSEFEEIRQLLIHGVMHAAADAAKHRDMYKEYLKEALDAS